VRRTTAGATQDRAEAAWWGPNVDAHLRSVLLGRSETIPIIDGALALGQFGRIYFADFDQMRGSDSGTFIAFRSWPVAKYAAASTLLSSSSPGGPANVTRPRLRT
jgi:Uncharacterised protein family UPF0047